MPEPVNSTSENEGIRETAKRALEAAWEKTRDEWHGSETRMRVADTRAYSHQTRAGIRNWSRR